MCMCAAPLAPSRTYRDHNFAHARAQNHIAYMRVCRATGNHGKRKRKRERERERETGKGRQVETPSWTVATTAVS